MKHKSTGWMRRIRAFVPALIFILGAPAIAAPMVHWTMVTEYPESTVSGVGISTFADLVSQQTAGEVEIVPSFDSGVSSGRLIASIEGGAVTGGDVLAGTLQGSSSLFSLPALPFLVQSTQDAVRLNELARPLYEVELRKHGLTLLYVTVWPATGLWSKHSIQGADGISALSVRTYDRTSERVMRQAGASAKQLPLNDVIPLLKEQQFNAVMSSGDGGAGPKLWRYLPTFTAIRYAQPVSIAVIRTSSLDALPARLRDVVLNAAAETEKMQITSLEARATANYARMQKNGVSIFDPPPPDAIAVLRRAAQDAIVEWYGRASNDARAVFRAFVNHQPAETRRSDASTVDNGA